MRVLIFGVLIGAVMLMAGCATVSDTGRRQLMFVSKGDEAKMGVTAFDEIKQQEKISKDAAANARVARVGKRIATAVGRDMDNAQWEFVVFDSDTVNAFALPGGKVGVYTGLLKLATTDDELAIVMGHEIAHVTSRHGAERTSQNYAVQAGAMLAAFGMGASGKVDEKTQAMVLAAYGAGTTVGVMLPFSRLHETEADSVGLKFAAGAGYDPRAGAAFWKKMSAQGGQKQPEWLSTHPADSTRIKNLEELAPKYMTLYEQSKGLYK